MKTTITFYALILIGLVVMQNELDKIPCNTHNKVKEINKPPLPCKDTCRVITC